MNYQKGLLTDSPKAANKQKKKIFGAGPDTHVGTTSDSDPYDRTRNAQPPPSKKPNTGFPPPALSSSSSSSSSWSRDDAVYEKKPSSPKELLQSPKQVGGFTSSRGLGKTSGQITRDSRKPIQVIYI